MSDTNAVKWLRTQGVKFDVLEHEFTELGADHAAAAVGRPLEMICKTLIVKATGNAFWIAIMPGDRRFDPRRRLTPSASGTPTSPTRPKRKKSLAIVSAAFAHSSCGESCRS
ncbi:MAG: aminoacyl-tRNA deacylase [Phycisphaerae bacterium]